MFDSIAAVAAGESGIAQAAVNKSYLLEEAKLIAVDLGRRKQFITADDVIRVYTFRHPHDPLGNAAGGIFRGTCWRFTGRTVRSERVNSHGRLIRVWEYIGK